MRYRIGILEKDEMYLEKLVEFLRRNHSDTLEIHDWQSVNLEEFAIESVNCDALFIGDGIYPERMGMPQDIRTAYLTADESRQGKNSIAKYQRLEQIYQQMIDVCAAEAEPEWEGEICPDADGMPQPEAPGYGAGHRFDDFALQTRHINGKTYKVYKIPDGGRAALDEVGVGMASNNKIKGLAELTRVGGELRYQITNKVCLVDFLRGNCGFSGKTKFLKIMNNILDTLLSLEDYMLLADQVVLNLSYIYLDASTLEPALLYYPLEDARRTQNVPECLAELIVLCGALFNQLNGYPDEGVEETPDLSERIDGEQENRASTSASTEVFSELQSAAQESRKGRGKTAALEAENGTPYLIRKKTGEKILVNRAVFKLGKEESYVDYCIKGNPTVSRNHADLVKKPEGFFVVDKGSLNHTFLNGRRIETGVYEKLASGDLVQIADEVFEFIKPKS